MSHMCRPLLFTGATTVSTSLYSIIIMKYNWYLTKIQKKKTMRQELLAAFLASLALACEAFSAIKTIQATNCRRKCTTLSMSNSGSENSRRDFLQRTATTGATLMTSSSSLVPASVSAATTKETTSTAPSKIATIKLPPLGLGAWAWGDSVFWGYDKKNDDELKRVYDYAVSRSKSSKVLFDTAELYGLGRSEQLLGDFSKDILPGKQVQVATKFAALPTRTKPESVLKACKASMKRLGGKPIDLYQIHFPNAWSNENYWDGLAMAYEQGLVKAVGVSNYGVDAVRACHAKLADRGIPLSTNQIQLSLLYPYPLQNGLMETCKELGVQVLAYSPLGLGMLTGKYSNENLPKGPRRVLFEKLQQTPDYNNLLAAMDTVASKHKGATKAQVAINWARAKGSIPIPGARTVSQVQKNYAALDWNLSKADEAFLEKAAAKVTTFTKPDASPFPKKDINTGLVLFDS